MSEEKQYQTECFYINDKGKEEYFFMPNNGMLIVWYLYCQTIGINNKGRDPNQKEYYDFFKGITIENDYNKSMQNVNWDIINR